MSYISDGKTTIDYLKLHNIGNEAAQVRSKIKKEYYSGVSKKVSDSLNSSKSYWSILQWF